MKKRLWLWTIGLWVLAALYMAGFAQGRPRAEYSPSTVRDAWLNASNIYHPDEFAYVGIPYRMLLRHQKNPHYFHNPSLNLYTNMAVFWLTRAQTLPHNITYGDREIAPFQLYVVARALSALYMLLAVALTYAAGRVAFNRRAGMIAAACFGLSVLTVQHAHYATPNAQTTLLATAALLVALLIFKGRYPGWLPHWAIYLAGGLLVGLTMSARYNAVVVGLVTGLAMLTAYRHHHHWLPVVVGCAAMPVGFALGTPAILVDPREVIDQIRDILDWYNQGGGGGFTAERAPEAYFDHWRYIVLLALGPGIVGAALAGLGSALRQRRKSQGWQDAWIGAVLALYLLAYTLLALKGRRLQANLLLVPLGPLVLLAGYAIDRWRRRQPRLAAGFLLFALAWPTVLSLLFVYRVTMPDTRERAQAWIYAHIPRGSTVYLLGPYNVPLDPLDYQTSQTYAGEAAPEQIRASDAQIIVYSDAYPSAAARDTTQIYSADRAREKAIQSVLETDWIELAHFKRMPWPGAKLAPDDVSYWHQVGITVYCNPDNCPAAP